MKVCLILANAFLDFLSSIKNISHFRFPPEYYRILSVLSWWHNQCQNAIEPKRMRNGERQCISWMLKSYWKFNFQQKKTKKRSANFPNLKERKKKRTNERKLRSRGCFYRLAFGIAKKMKVRTSYIAHRTHKTHPTVFLCVFAITFAFLAKYLRCS